MGAGLVTADMPRDMPTGHERYKHQWRTGSEGIKVCDIPRLNDLCSGKWGFHFVPVTPRRKLIAESEIVLTFEREEDMIAAMLTISF